ncbi:hypothetical protein Tco_0885350 [Tanacetum coccineum]
MADSLIGNHPEDDFTPLETIRRSHSIIGKRISFEFEGKTFESKRRDLSFLPKEPSPAFCTSSPSMSVNTEPLMTDEEPVLQPTKATTDSGGSPKREFFVVHPGSVAARMKNRKYKTRGGSSMPPVKRKLVPGSSTACATRAKTSASKDDVSFLTISDEDEGLSDVPELKDATACHLKILNITPPDWKNHLDNYMDLELLDIHDRCYARQAFIDNVVNRRSHELLGVIEKLRAKCEAAMSDFEKNPTVVTLREKISTLSSEAKEYKANLDWMMLESQKWAGYQANLSSLESHVVSLEAEKARLEAVKLSLRKEVNDARRDTMEVVSKVFPYAAMELIHSDDLDSLVGKLVTSAIVYRRSDPSAPVEVLLSKKPPSIQKPAPSKTRALVTSSQKATSSSIPASNMMSPPADTFVVKPSSF